MKAKILKRVAHSPIDISRKIISAVQGTLGHGAFLPYQNGSLRPIPELGEYKTPVPNVYLCSSGSHPGPGVSMAPGRNAAQVIFSDLGWISGGLSTSAVTAVKGSAYRKTLTCYCDYESFPASQDDPVLWGRSKNLMPKPIARLRQLCLALPDAWEKESHGEPTFWIGKSMFASFANAANRSRAGRHAVWCKASHVTQDLSLRARTRPVFPAALCWAEWLDWDLSRPRS